MRKWIGNISALAGFIITVTAVLCCAGTAAARAEETADGNGSLINRFNIMLVMDASGSMNDTDPEGWRYDAVDRFVYLLAEQGNYLGGLTFSNHVITCEGPRPVNDRTSKERIVEMLEAAEGKGYTNIGEALSTAVKLLTEEGNPDLPSVILLLSDGNTEMPTEEEHAESVSMKEDAIRDAWENGIQIYSVCLNEDNEADMSEMSQITQATGGESREIRQADHLHNVLEMYYGLIYGTSIYELEDTTFPADGVLESLFTVPGIGVEEINIIIEGKVAGMTLLDPHGDEADVETSVSNTSMIFKMTEPVEAGEWRLITEGIPGDRIGIKMVYNSNLEIEVETKPDTMSVQEKEPLSVYAVLRSGTVRADTKEQYTGYSASLQILDSNEEEVVDTIPMNADSGRLAAKCRLPRGYYYMEVHVEGEYFQKAVSHIGPVEVREAAGLETDPSDPAPQERNTPPVPLENPVERTVCIWPFRDNSLELDLSTLAVDEEGGPLHYRIEATPFMEGEDYTLGTDQILRIHHYSLSKGFFDIRVTDPKGLSCNVEVIVKSYNVGMMTLFGVGAAAAVALAVFLILLYIALTKPFRGGITVESWCNGVQKGRSRSPKRGRCRLSAFGLDPVGINYNRSWLQATGGRYIYLEAKKAVFYNGQQTEKVRIQSGTSVKVRADRDDTRYLIIRFDSHMK
jgi:hypothetical protein